MRFTTSDILLLSALSRTTTHTSHLAEQLMELERAAILRGEDRMLEIHELRGRILAEHEQSIKATTLAIALSLGVFLLLLLFFHITI